MPKPNLFLIWEPKGGTTIIHHYLSQHPNIFMSEPKEPSHFDTDHFEEAVRFHGEKKAKSIFKYTNKESYLSLFDQVHNEKVIWESSTNYAYSKKSAENIYNFNHESKIIYIIREPLSFLESWYLQIHKTWSEDSANFSRALKLEKMRKLWKKIPASCKYPSLLFYSERIKYSENLQRYLNYFPNKNIKVIIYEEFKENNQKVINEITDFLWLQRTIISYRVKNKKRFTRYKFLRNLIRNVLPKSVRKRFWPYLGRIIYSQNTNKKIANYSKDKLMKEIKPEVKKLNNLLHKNNLIESKKDLLWYWWYNKV